MTKVKIANLGSCVGRDALRSYYNNYKEDYDVIFSEQRISFISLMHPRVDYEPKKFDTYVSDVNAMFFRNDFQKSFFNSIKNDLDYLIIDFVFDVKYGVLKFNDTYITGSRLWDDDIWGMEKTEFFKENESNLSFLRLDNDFKEYFNLWKDAIDKFFNFMLINYPNVKIILCEVQFVDYVLKKDGSYVLNPFFKEHVDYLNPLAKKLDKYVEDNYDVRVIEFPKNITADENHIWGVGSEHYNRNYYEYFYKELYRIILEDKLSVFESLDMNYEKINENLKNSKEIDTLKEKYKALEANYSKEIDTLKEKYKTLESENSVLKEDIEMLMHENEDLKKGFLHKFKRLF